MSPKDLNRRDFNRLTMAAFGGAVAGSMAGCNEAPPAGTGKPAAKPEAGSAGPAAAADEKTDAAAVTAMVHACRGLNECKGQGKSGDNACAGQGACSTAKEHLCGGMNECKFQGGCGEKPGANDCKGQGGCHVPMTNPDMWESARKAFEERMNAAGKKFGAAPAA